MAAEADLARYKAGWDSYLATYRTAGIEPSILRPLLSIARDLAPYALAVAAIIVGLMSLDQ